MTEISETVIEAFGAALASRTGLHFPATRRRELLRGLARAATAFGFAGDDASEACTRWLLAERPTRRQAEILASHLTVGETYFFREPATFAALEQQILPALIAARRTTGKRLRIWSVGCSTGEETYSLAIVLARLIPDIEDWSITLLGTDINPHFLASAARGTYREWSFRGVPAWIRKGYFNDLGGGNYALLPRVKQLARFDYLNLVDDAYPSFEKDTAAMDIVLCRHVLMYFDVATARAVVQRLRRSLVDGGWLIVSQTETGAPLLSEFTQVTWPDCFVYRKNDDGQAVSVDSCWWTGTDGNPSTLAQSSLAEERWLDISMNGTTVGAAGNTGRSAATEPLPRAHEATDSKIDASALARDDRCNDEPALNTLRAEGSEEPQDPALLARACANAGRLGDARHWCEAAVSADKFNPELRYLLASILIEQGHAEGAVACLKQALYLDQNFVLAHFALGNIYRRDGHADQATRHFRIAARLLRACAPDTCLPSAEGLRAARLLSIIETMEPAP
ncbi:CheR family methyltransferase [Trinickia fusca]|uniref:Tetratricopeptide repeat protein n=1 Tax=Trinickia fusca TaxID=2419777 RepID=A0A494X6X5_9BURK|nr:protein-glutamate O-methyltransferase CheR [Trinickia fusca]RKP46457.1 tetratricopeptide repeat protein [Trinickia fusca]